MATLPQYNQALGAYNSAILGEQYSGGATGTGSGWTNYNDLLDRYGIGNGSTTGVGGIGSNGIGGGTAAYGAGSSTGTAGSASTGATGGPAGFSLNPAPQSGSGTYGAVPGAIGAPPSIWQQTQAIPGMSGLTSQNTGLIGSQLNGNLSASTVGNLTDAAAARGVSLGQGGSTGLTNEILLKTLGLTHEQLQQQGQQNYLSFLGASGQQQQNPELLAEIASRNATMAAAPNPTLAAQQLQALSRGSSTQLRNPLAGLNLNGNSSTAFNGQIPGGSGTYGIDPSAYSSIYGNAINPASGSNGFGGSSYDDFSSEPDQSSYDPSANTMSGQDAYDDFYGGSQYDPSPASGGGNWDENPYD